MRVTVDLNLVVTPEGLGLVEEMANKYTKDFLSLTIISGSTDETASAPPRRAKSYKNLNGASRATRMRHVDVMFACVKGHSTPERVTVLDMEKYSEEYCKKNPNCGFAATSTRARLSDLMVGSEKAYGGVIDALDASRDTWRITDKGKRWDALPRRH